MKESRILRYWEAFQKVSGVTGVSYSKRDKRWRSYITVKHVRYSLGYFKDKESAIQARKKIRRRISSTNLAKV